MPLTVQPATLADAENLARISRQTFYDSFARYNTEANMQKHMDAYYAVGRLREELADAKNFFFLAMEDDNIVGYLKANIHLKNDAGAPDTSLELERIYAVTTAIGKGVGKALMQHCMQTAKEHGRTTIWLGVWEHNQRAIGFYQQWGFQKFGEHIFMVGDDPQTDWLMKKTVEPAD